MLPPQRGHLSTSIAKTRRRRSAQASRRGRRVGSSGCRQGSSGPGRRRVARFPSWLDELQRVGAEPLPCFVLPLARPVEVAERAWTPRRRVALAGERLLSWGPTLQDRCRLWAGIVSRSFLSARASSWRTRSRESPSDTRSARACASSSPAQAVAQAQDQLLARRQPPDRMPDARAHALAVENVVRSRAVASETKSSSRFSVPATEDSSEIASRESRSSPLERAGVRAQLRRQLRRSRLVGPACP